MPLYNSKEHDIEDEPPVNSNDEINLNLNFSENCV